MHSTLSAGSVLWIFMENIGCALLIEFGSLNGNVVMQNSSIKYCGLDNDKSISAITNRH